MCLLGLENDLFRLETQVSTTLQRNSRPAGTRCNAYVIQLSEQIVFIISSVLSDDTKTNILAVTNTIRLPTSLSLWLVHERSKADFIKFNDSIEG